MCALENSGVHICKYGQPGYNIRPILCTRLLYNHTTSHTRSTLVQVIWLQVNRQRSIFAHKSKQLLGIINNNSYIIYFCPWGFLSMHPWTISVPNKYYSFIDLILFLSDRNCECVHPVLSNSVPSFFHHETIKNKFIQELQFNILISAAIAGVVIEFPLSPNFSRLCFTLQVPVASRRN